MKNCGCPHCGSVDVFIQEKGTQTGLYCGDCSKWIKWLSKNEIALVERFVEENKKTPTLSSKIQELESICRTVSDYLKQNYDTHTTVMITDSHIKLVHDEIGIPVKRCDL
jgi:hypothetical protein